MSKEQKQVVPPERRRALSHAMEKRNLERQVKKLEEELETDKEAELGLSPQQIKFCELFVDGGMKLTGNPGECYKKAFDCTSSPYARSAGRKLLSKPYIKTKIDELIGDTAIHRQAIKSRITETLLAVMDETSTDIYRDKYGEQISPAALRAVTINAARALADIHGLKAVQETQLTVNSDTGVVFNVITPQINSNEDKE